MMDFLKEISVTEAPGSISGVDAAGAGRVIVIAGTKGVYTLVLMIIDAVPATIVVGIFDDVKLKPGRGTVQLLLVDIRQLPRGFPYSFPPQFTTLDICVRRSCNCS
jgi:hypothetical protein